MRPTDSVALLVCPPLRWRRDQLAIVFGASMSLDTDDVIASQFYFGNVTGFFFAFSFHFVTRPRRPADLERRID